MCNFIKPLYFFYGFLFFLGLSPQLSAQTQTEGVTDKDIKYLSYQPDGYDGIKEFPLLIFMHGLGEKGDNLEVVKRNGPPNLISNGKWDKDLPFIVISPQLPSRYNNWPAVLVNDVLEYVLKNYKVDLDRIYLTGLSLGGNGVWNFLVKYPEKIAAAVPIAGWGNTNLACVAAEVPVWAFHGDADGTIAVNRAIGMINSVNNCSPSVPAELTIYPGVGHNSWARTYDLSAGHDIYTWMLSYTNKREAANIPPIANAGEAQTLVLPNNSIQLAGSGVDKDGTISSYLWEKINGPRAVMEDIDKPTLKLTSLEEGTYTLKLTVTDNRGATGTDQVIVTVKPIPNQKPIADAGADISITLPDNQITIVGSGRDLDGEIVAFQWDKLSGPPLTLDDKDKEILKVSNLVEGIYTLRLTVTDNLGETDTDEVMITVKPEPLPANQAPIADAGGNKIITLPLNDLLIHGSGEDADGEIISYEWIKVSGPEVTMSNSDEATLQLSDLVEGVYTFKLTIKDDKGAVSSDIAIITVNPAPNLPPIAYAGGNKTITLPENSLSLTGEGQDSDGHIESYLWEKISGPEVVMNDSDSPTLLIQELEEGVYIFQLTVKDNENAIATDQVKVTVRREEISENQIPIVDAGGNKTITLPENTLEINGFAQDNDGIIITYEWTKESGPQATMEGTDNTNLKLSNLVEGIYVLKLTVVDDKGASSSDEISVTVKPAPNKPPVANAGGNKTITLPQNNLSIFGSGEDSDGTIEIYQWTKVSGPTLTMTGADNAELKLSDMIEGTYTFVLVVTDNRGATSSDEIKVIVKPAPNQSPEAYAGNDKTISLPNDVLTIEGSGEDPDGIIISYLWTKESGPEVRMEDVNTTRLRLSHLLEGTYIFRLTVTDNKGATATDDVKVTVKLPPNQLPSADAGSDLLLHLPNNKTQVKGKGTDPDGKIVAFQWSKVSGPSVSISDAYTSVLTLSDMVAGVYVFSLTVIDDRGGKAEDNVTIRVNEPPIANAGRDKTITLPTNSTYISGAGSDKDGTIINYSWSKKSGPMATMKFEDSYLLQLSDLEEGIYIFTLTVTDNRGATASDDIKLTVLPMPNLPPTVHAGRDQKIQLPTNSLQLIGSASDPDGEITAYLWTQIKGPSAKMEGIDGPVLQLSHLVEGDYSFRLTVTDDKGDIAYDEVRVIVEKVIVNISLDITTIDNNCFGANDGYAKVFVSGGEMPYTYYWSNGETTEEIAGLGAGSYTVTVTDKLGRTAKATVHIKQQDELLITVDIANESNRRNDGSITAHVTGGSAPYKYIWSNGTEGKVNSDLHEGEYSLTVYDANGCSSTQNFQVGRFREYKTSIYPNPSVGGKFKISFDNLESGHYQLNVYDAFGAVVFEKHNEISAVSQVETLDLSNKGKGIYFVKIIYDGKYEETTRIIVQ